MLSLAGTGSERTGLMCIIEPCCVEMCISALAASDVVTPVNVKDQALSEAAERLYGELEEASVEALLDDRDERAGVKFNDADLIGVPFRITVGKKIKEGKVELLTRATRASEDVPIDSVVARLRSQI